MNTKSTIEQKLRDSLSPLHLEVQNESHMHNVPEGSESHFKIVAASKAFEGKTLLARHRMINQLLSHELANGIHALTMHTMTPEEWLQKGASVPDSPPCMGGSEA
jgi:BolA protein